MKKFKKGTLKGGLEPIIAKQLRRIRNKINVSYETVALPYTVRKNYWPDFVCQRPDGSTFYLEVKGYFRAEDRVKLRAVKQENPGIDVRLVFGANNKISSKSKMRYSDWCDKYGFPYCIKEVPQEWFQ
jgi:hypothetical protein